MTWRYRNARDRLTRVMGNARHDMDPDTCRHQRRIPVPVPAVHGRYNMCEGCVRVIRLTTGSLDLEVLSDAESQRIVRIFTQSLERETRADGDVVGSGILRRAFKFPTPLEAWNA